MKNILGLLFAVWFLASCQNNAGKTPVVGEIDSVAIAQDTAMQLGFESSYEYHKTLVVNEKLVYDVVGFGGSASQGEFAILRRGADNKADTVVKSIRNGVIVNSFIDDLNQNEQREIYITTQSVGSGSYAEIIVYEIEPSGKLISLSVQDFTKEVKGDTYRGHDSLYIADDEVILEYPVYKKDDANCCPSGGLNKIHYRLLKNKLIKVDYIKE